MRILNIKLNNKIIYQLIKESLPLFISALSVNLYMRIDQLMLLKMLSSYELGIYSGVIKLTEIWYFIPNIIYILFIPKIAFLRKNSIVKSNEYIKEHYFHKHHKEDIDLSDSGNNALNTSNYNVDKDNIVEGEIVEDDKKND